MSAKNLSILVIDDSSTIRKITCDFLLKAGFNVVSAESIEDALEEFSSMDIAIVVSDLIMPGIGGVAGISLVREQWKHVGVIAMTAGSKQIKPISLLNIARSAGAHKLLEKPFTEEKLIDQVRALISEGFGTSNRRRKIMVIEDSTTLRKMFDKVLSDSGYDCILMEDADVAIASPDILGIDCVITDIFMPGKGGIQGIQEIRASWPKVPIIAMSGGVKNSVGANEALMAAKRCGANDTLQKPFPPKTLLDALAKLV